MIFLVDDNDDLRLALEEYIATFGYDVESFASAESMLAALDSGCFDVKMLITDVKLPGLGGRALVELFRRICPGVPVIVISGCLGTDSSWKIPCESIDFFSKPINFIDFSARIAYMMKLNDARPESPLPG